MDRCGHAYRNGRTMEESKELAEKMNLEFQKIIAKNGQVSWTEILENVDHDELVYKLSLKYLRRDGFEIGNYKTPRVRPILD